MKKDTVLTLFMLFFSLFSFAQNEKGIVLPKATILEIKTLDSNKQYFLAPHCEIWTDVANQKTILDVLENDIQRKFVPLELKQIDLNANAYWVKCSVNNLNRDSLRLAFYFRAIENLNVYIFPATLGDTLGLQQPKPVIQRSFKKYRELTYLKLPPQQSTIYFHVRIEQGIYKAFIQESFGLFSFFHGDYQNIWTKYKASIYAFTLLFLGALSLMFLYNLVLFFILLDNSYLFYVAYLFFFGLRVFVERDFYADWIAPEPPKYALLLSLIMPVLFTIFQLLFTRSFLELKKNIPWASRLVWVLIGGLSLNLLLMLSGLYRYFYIFYAFTIIVSNVGLLVIAVATVIKNRKTTAFFYLLGVIALIIGMIVYILIPATSYNIYTFNGVLIGSLIEMSLFSLGLASKINEAKKALVEQKLVQAQEREALIEEKNEELGLKVTQRTAELEESNATKDKLFSIISHDLRSPLNALKGMLSVLEVGILSEKELKSISKDIQKRLGNIDETLNNLLQWAGSQMNGATTHKEEIQLSNVIALKIDWFDFVSDHKDIQLINAVAETTKVYADINHLQIILRNLIANAFKFTPKNGVITVAANHGNDDFITISVADNGVGIAKEQVHKLFEKSTLYTTRGINNEKGTGLGLLLCKDFVEKNGGQIWVESEVGKGSTFYFTLPKVAHLV